MSLTGLMVMKQARKYHEDLNIEGECAYSKDWLQKFKKHHGIKYLKFRGEKFMLIIMQLNITLMNLPRWYLLETLVLSKYTMLIKQLSTGRALYH